MSKIIDDIIQSCIASQYVFSKAHFDNAKDTNALIFAANQNAQTLTEAVEYKIKRRVDELLIERIESVRGDGEFIVKVGDTMYRISEY